jgi:hypothetical protein
MPSSAAKSSSGPIGKAAWTFAQTPIIATAMSTRGQVGGSFSSSRRYSASTARIVRSPARSCMKRYQATPIRTLVARHATSCEPLSRRNSE